MAERPLLTRSEAAMLFTVLVGILIAFLLSGVMILAGC